MNHSPHLRICLSIHREGFSCLYFRKVFILCGICYVKKIFRTILVPPPFSWCWIAAARCFCLGLRFHLASPHSCVRMISSYRCQKENLLRLQWLWLHWWQRFWACRCISPILPVLVLARLRLSLFAVVWIPFQEYRSFSSIPDNISWWLCAELRIHEQHAAIHTFPLAWHILILCHTRPSLPLIIAPLLQAFFLESPLQCGFDFWPCRWRC